MEILVSSFADLGSEICGDNQKPEPPLRRVFCKVEAQSFISVSVTEPNSIIKALQPKPAYSETSGDCMNSSSRSPTFVVIFQKHANEEALLVCLVFSKLAFSKLGIQPKDSAVLPVPISQGLS